MLFLLTKTFDYTTTTTILSTPLLSMMVWPVGLPYSIYSDYMAIAYRNLPHTPRSHASPIPLLTNSRIRHVHSYYHHYLSRAKQETPV